MSALLGALVGVLWIALIGAGVIPLLRGGRAASATRQAAMIAIGLGLLAALAVGIPLLGLVSVFGVGGEPATPGAWVLYALLPMVVPGILVAAAAFGGYGLLTIPFGFSRTALLGTVVLPACAILGSVALNQLANGLAEWERADRAARENAAIEERSRVISPRIEVVSVDPASTPGEILRLTVDVTLSATAEVRLRESGWDEISAHRIIPQPNVIVIGPDWTLSPEQIQANYDADITRFLPAVVDPDHPLTFRVMLTKTESGLGLPEGPGLPGPWTAWLPLLREDGELMSWTIPFEVPAPPWPSPSASPSPTMPP